MKEIIRKREYDTETATVVKKVTSGYYGDPCGYEEILFKTPGGLYFQYGRGGQCSAYPQETITCVAKTKVKAWLESHN